MISIFKFVLSDILARKYGQQVAYVLLNNQSIKRLYAIDET